MKQYIDKATVAEEIERRKEHYENIQMIKYIVLKHYKKIIIQSLKP